MLVFTSMGTAHTCSLKITHAWRWIWDSFYTVHYMNHLLLQTDTWEKHWMYYTCSLHHCYWLNCFEKLNYVETLMTAEKCRFNSQILTFDYKVLSSIKAWILFWSFNHKGEMCNFCATCIIKWNCKSNGCFQECFPCHTLW